MAVSLRPYAASDLAGGLALLRRAVDQGHHASDNQEWHAAIWRWLECHPLADSLQRWVLEEDGQVIGFLAAMPQGYRIAHQRLIAHTPTDFMVMPGHGFHALALMRAFFRSCPNCVTCDRLPEPIAIEKRLGGLYEVGILHSAAKLLGLLPRTPLPAALHRLVTAGLHFADDRRIGRRSDEPLVTPVTHFDTSFDRFFEQVAAAIPCLAEKDSAFLTWRYGPASPHGPVTILGVSQGAERLGYAVLSLSPTREASLLDLTTLPGRSDVARALLRAAIDRARAAGAFLIRHRFLESPVAVARDDLAQFGFFFPKKRLTLLAKFADPILDQRAQQRSAWAYAAGDGEASFFQLASGEHRQQLAINT